MVFEIKEVDVYLDMVEIDENLLINEKIIQNLIFYSYFPSMKYYYKKILKFHIFVF